MNKKIQLYNELKAAGINCAAIRAPYQKFAFRKL